MRIAVISETSPFDRKGLFNAVHNRILHLLKTERCEVEVFCVHSWDSSFTRRIRHTPKIASRDESVRVDGIIYRMLWYDFSVIDHVLVEILHRKPLFFTAFMNRHLHLFKDFDAVVAHSFTGGVFACETKRRYGVPYFVNWHGSDVHTHPVRNPLLQKETRTVMENAVCNFFVSRALLAQSDCITVNARKSVLYNGVSETFVRYDESVRAALRTKYGVSPEDKVVAFVGSIVAVKNVRILQPLFHEIRARYDGPLKFWMVGDGKMRSVVEPSLHADDTVDVRFWGDVPADEMPSVMNCIDVLVLPSLNEGLPLVCAEAVMSGAAVVGSDVGGVREVIGEDSVVPLQPSDDFAVRFAEKAVRYLNARPDISLPSVFSWDSTAEKEIEALSELLR